MKKNTPNNRLISIPTLGKVICIVIACVISSAYGETGKLRSLNPSDIHFHTFNYEKEGNTLRREKKYDAAIEQYGKANELFNTIKINYPTWNPHIIDRGFERIKKLVEETLKERNAQIDKEKAPALYPSLKDGDSLSERAKKRAESVLGNDKNLKDLSTRLNEIKEKISAKEKQVQEQERQGSTKAELLSHLKKKDAKLKKIQAENAEQEKRAASRQQLLSDEVLALRKQLEDVKRQKADDASLKQRNLASEIALKDASIKELKENAAELRTENKAHQSSLHEQIKELNKKVALLNSSNPKVQKLSSESEEKTRKLEALNKEITEIKEEQETLIKEKVSAVKEAKKVKLLLAEREKEKDLLREKLSQKENLYVEKLSSLAEKIQALEKARPSAENASLNSEKTEELQEEINIAKAVAEVSQEKVKQATKEAENAKKEAESLQQQKQLNEVQALAEITQKESELLGEKQKTEEIKAENKTIKEELTEKASSLNSAVEELKRLKTQHEATLKEKEVALSEVTKHAELKNTQISKLEKKLINMEERATTAGKKERSLLDNITLLNKTLKKTQQDQENVLLSLASFKEDNSKLKDEITILKEERNILLSRPLRSEVETLKSDLRTSIAEKETLAKSLTENESKYYEAIGRIEQLQEELETTRNATSKLEGDMKEERVIANDVIKTQRERLTSQNKELIAIKRKLAKEEAQALRLQDLVDQTKEQYGEIQNQYDGLLAEHEQLKTLLKADKSEDQLKQENATLMRDLALARSKFEKALGSEETSNEDLLIARKKYAIMRTELYKTKHKLELANLRGDKVVRKLQETEAELKIAATANDSQYTVEEVTMLKELLTKHQDMQQSRKMARSLILEEVKRMGGDDTQILAALDLAETQELILSDDQKQLLANPNADSEFRFSERASPEERKRAEAALNQRLSVHDKLGRSAYSKGHFLAAEEFFQINLEDHPGHIPSMLNLGVSRLRRAEKGGESEDYLLAITSFEDALAMRGDDGLPYALQMLGYANFKQGLDEEAVKYFQQCIEADPTNAKAHIFLGSLMADSGDLPACETHLKKALSIDPTLTEPQYNLALLLNSQGKHQEALKNYRQALVKGAPSDPSLEGKLRLALPEANFN